MVSEATINKYAGVLLNYYVAGYETKHGHPPVINRHRDKWGFRNMYEDIGVDQGKATIDYFLRTPRPDHLPAQLFQNYDRLNLIRLEQEQDEVDRVRLRQETEARVREWEQKIGNSRG